MNYNELKKFVEEARIAKGYSQRELSKMIGLSQSTYNDTINGKIKKVDVDILRKIAQGLDLSLKKILEVSGYIDFLDSLVNDEREYRTIEEAELRIEKNEKQQKEYEELKQEKSNKINEVRNILTELVNILEKENNECSAEKIILEINDVLKILEIFDVNSDYEKFLNEDGR